MNLIRKRKQESGITLVALIITVIIMLILAGVAISAVINGDGLFNKTRNAAVEYERAVEKENQQLAELTSEIDRYMNELQNSKGLTLSYAKEAVSDFCVVIDLKTVLGDEYEWAWLYINDVWQEDYSEYTLDSYRYPVYENGDYTFEVYVEGITERTMESITINVSEITAEIPDVYAALYTNGTLVFSNNSADIDSTQVSKTYGNINGTRYSSEDTTPWMDDYTSITNVKFLNTVSPINTSSWFEECHYLTTIDLTNLDTSSVIDMSNMFSNCSVLTTIIGLENLDTSSAKYMAGMFQECDSMISINVSGLDTENVIDMSNMFHVGGYSSDLSEIKGLNMLDTSKVMDMSNMFSGCSRLTSIDVSGFDTSKVMNMSEMFSGLGYVDVGVSEIKGLNTWDTSNVTDMSYMFAWSEVLTSIDVSAFDTSKVTDMSYMFAFCYALTSIDVSSFDTSKVTDMSRMFASCGALTSIDVSSFDTNEVTDMSRMFNECSGLTTIYVSDLWSVANVSQSYDMFADCTNLIGAIPYDSTKIDSTYANYTTGYLTKKQ